MYSEQKIADGIYITKAKPQNDERKINERKFVYRSTAELIAILEAEFEEYLREIEMLYNANEEMLEFDPHDYDLIQAREDNLILINKRLIQLQDIQNELKIICPTNPLVGMNVYDHVLKDEKKEEEVESNQKQVEDEIIPELEL
jgi:hypothetical protein